MRHVVVCVPCIKHTHGRHDKMIRARNHHRGCVLEKVRIRAEPHAVADPRAVVVHSKHAATTNSAVMRSGWLECTAFEAVALVVAPLRHSPPYGNATCIGSHTAVIRVVHIQDQYVEYTKHNCKLFECEGRRSLVVGPHDADLRRYMEEKHENHYARYPDNKSINKSSCERTKEYLELSWALLAARAMIPPCQCVRAHHLEEW